MQHQFIKKETMSFLTSLAMNNNREWFNANKNLYLDAQSNLHSFIDDLLIEMNKHDEIENVSGKKSLHRIYNDVRFSKDKSPYSSQFSFGLRRATKYKRGGYYVSIKPGNSFLACGFFAPNPADLKRIRNNISANYFDWKKLLNMKEIMSNFGKIQGRQVPTVPRGFAKEHEAIDLIRNQQFILRHNFTDNEVLSVDFVLEVNKIFKSVRPFFNHMSEILTTNANGELDI